MDDFSGKRNILVIPTNRAEHIDLDALLNQAEVRQHYNLHWFTTEAIYRLPAFAQHYSQDYTGIIYGTNPFQQAFNHSSKYKKAIIALINARHIIRYCKRHNITLLMSSTPSIFIRIAHWWLGKSITHLSYLRSAYPGIDVKWCDSEMLEAFLKRWLGIKNTAFIKNYHADRFLVTGTSSKLMLEKRDYDEKDIRIIGPATLFYAKTKKEEESKKTRQSKGYVIVYALQAFKAHHDMLGHNSQYEMLRTVLTHAKISSDITGFIIRMHPHDKMEYYQDLFDEYKDMINFDEQSSEDFLLNQQDNHILIAATSTLLFEWVYMGGKAYAASASQEFLDKYHLFFKATNISPYFNAKKLIEHVVQGKGYISEESASQVMATADHCDFTPDNIVQYLAKI